jgi:transposase
LAEISSPYFPGERLVACHNPLLAAERHRTRQELLAATEKQLEKIVRTVQRRTKTPLSESQIGLKAGRVVNRFKMAKHFDLTISPGQFAYSRKIESIRQEEQLDGIYVIRTSEPAKNISAEQTVRGYKSLAQVERGFRCLKGLDLLIRPIHHRTETHVKAHIFLCLLAYYVEWHMRQALAPVLFADEQVEAERQTRDAVAPAQPSAAARQKRATHQTASGLPAHSFRTMLNELSTLCRNTCSLKREPASQFTQLTVPTPIQAAVFKLLGL